MNSTHELLSEISTTITCILQMEKMRPREIEQLITQLVGGSWDLNPGRLWHLLWAVHFCGTVARSVIPQSRKPRCGLGLEFSSDCLKVHIIFSSPAAQTEGKLKYFVLSFTIM